MTTDAKELLQTYVAEKSEAAFTEFVSRHLNLVYSASLRQVGGNRELAAEVTQRVFTDAARKARSLATHPAIAAWLFTSAHHAAAFVLRAEARRRRREHRAYVMSTTDAPEPEVDWTEIRPVIDAAMHRLGDRERAVLVLRFFEQVPVAEIGSRFGITDRGARKIVDRGLERLRETLARHGITSTSGALAAALSASAVTAAPASIALRISQGALAGASVASGWGSAVAIPFMTAMHKTVIGVLAAGLMGGLFVTQELGSRRAEAEALRAQNDLLVRRERVLRSERDEARRKASEGPASPMAGPSTVVVAPPAEVPQVTLAAKVSRMKELFEGSPERKIPELELLNDDEWAAVLQELKVDTPPEIQEAQSKLRNAATRKVAGLLVRAARDFQVANGAGTLSAVQQLADFFPQALPKGLLDRYEVTTNEGRQSLDEKRSTIIDPFRDDWHQSQIVAPGQGGFGFSGNAFQTDVGQARRAYAAANNGAQAETLEQLAPFLKSPVPSGK